MSISKRLFLIVAGALLAGGGGWIAIIGFDRDDGSYARNLRSDVPFAAAAAALVNNIAPFLRQIPPEVRGHLALEEKGLLYPLGGGGGFIAFVGAVMLLNGFFRGKKSRYEEPDQAAREEDTRISDSEIAESSGVRAAPRKDAVSIDENIIDEQQEEDDKLRDINYLVTISHADLQPDMVARVVRMFRPDLEQYTPLFNEAGANKLAHQILSSVILRHRRRSKTITADQFHAQDQRITECEREAFCHRYMPPQDKIQSDDIREIVGKVYDSYTRSEVQKRVAGEADDWMDVSLRNAADVLGAQTALEQKQTETAAAVASS